MLLLAREIEFRRCFCRIYGDVELFCGASFPTGLYERRDGLQAI
jgi:hypothetical protein